MKTFLCIIILISQPLLCSAVSAFEIDGSKWPGAAAVFYIDLEGVAASGVSWNAAFDTAINEWNSKTPFTFTVVPEHRDPCASPGVNAVDFAADLCGSSFGKNVLAIERSSYRSEILGAPSIIESDIVINSTETFNVYDGNLFRIGFPGVDLQRVALHELGHSIGLGHSQSSNAIMRPIISNLFQLQADDIQAIETLYGGLSNCTVSEFRFGVINGTLDAVDCTVEQLTVSPGDDSFIDVFRFDVATTTTFDFTMTSTSLDSVLLVANADLQVISFDNKPRTSLERSCNSSLSVTLEAGQYFLLANTFDEPLDALCTDNGGYQIATTVRTSQFLSLATTESFSGGPGFGAYSGGITANKGATYGNQFRASDTLDAEARIVIDPAHQGRPGFLVVAALIDADILLLNAAGDFVPYSNNGVFERAVGKTLGAVEVITIFSDLVPADLGITAIVVDFVVGYGLDANPGEVYYHTTPLNLTITP